MAEFILADRELFFALFVYNKQHHFVLTNWICSIQIMHILSLEFLVKVVFQNFWGIFDWDSFDRLDLLYTNHVSYVIDIDCHHI